MKAVQFARFGGADVLEYVDVPQPSPHSGDVLIEVTAAGLNYSRGVWGRTKLSCRSSGKFVPKSRVF
jgi:NADPH:quinone reductase-like Zn-dependent oxidoreductase